jgi:anti-sigma factor RsiW
MSCSPFDLRDYLLDELAEEERRQVDQHMRSCGGCHEELERLRITHSTLLAWREEEVPQRIGFVSDKVFEPSPVRRVWQAFWGSSAKLGFASAAMLSAALVFFTFFRQAPAVASVAPLDTSRIEAQVAARVSAAVEKAVAESEARQAGKTAALLTAAEERFDRQRQADQLDMLNVKQNLDVLQKRYNVRENMLVRYEPPGEMK